MRLTERDRRVLCLLARLKCMTTPQVTRLPFFDGITHRAVVARRRLRKMREGGYIKSVRRDLYDPYMHYCTKRGRGVVDTPRELQAVRSNGPLEHYCMVSEIVSRLYPRLIGFECPSEHGKVKADALLSVRLSTKHKRLVFLEADRGTEGMGALRKKARAYAALYSSGVVQGELGTFPQVWIYTTEGRKEAVKEAFPEARVGCIAERIAKCIVWDTDSAAL